MKEKILELRKKFQEETNESVTYGTNPEPFYCDEYVEWLEKIALKQANGVSTDSGKSNIPNVSNMLPDGFLFEDEFGHEVAVIGIVDKWCMVEDVEHEEPYVLPLEYVYSIYEESKEGNYS